MIKDLPNLDKTILCILGEEEEWKVVATESDIKQALLE